MEEVGIDLVRMREVASGCGWTFAELAAFYAPRARAEITGIRDAVAADDVPTVARLTHGAAGSSATIGMDSMATRFRSMSQKAPALTAAQLSELVEDVDRHLARVLEKLAELVRNEL